MNRSDIRTEVQRLLNDQSAIVYTNAIVNDWIDLGVVDIGTQLGLDTAQATFAVIGSNTFASSEPNYQLPSNAMNIREVYLADQDDEEKRFTVYEQDELNTLFGLGWRSTTEVGVPAVAFRADYNVVGLFPRPNADHNGNTLRVFYDRVPSDLASDTDTPTVIAALHDALTMYCVSRGHDTKSDTGRSNYYMQRYENMIARFKHKQLRFSDDLQRFRW